MTVETQIEFTHEEYSLAKDAESPDRIKSMKDGVEKFVNMAQQAEQKHPRTLEARELREAADRKKQRLSQVLRARNFRKN